MKLYDFKKIFTNKKKQQQQQPDRLQKLLNELKEVREEIKIREQNFNYLTDEYIDASIYELHSLEIKHNAILKEIKQLTKLIS